MQSKRLPYFGVLLALSIAVAAILGACGSSGQTGPGSFDASPPGSGGDATNRPDVQRLGGPDSGLGKGGPLKLAPLNATLSVPYGTQSPTLTFHATEGGQAVPAVFSIDLEQIGVIGSSSGVLTPTGKLGGVAHVTATFGGQTTTTSVTVTLKLVQSGAPPGLDGGGGVGGNGGVGGSGPGGPVSAAGQKVLTGTAVADTGLSWLYPYDKTVWPQGLLAPLLQWQPGAVGNYDAVYIHLTENGFDYSGFFSAPATPFINHPILQSVWDALSFSNQGEPVLVTLVFSSGGKAYGGISETWTIAQAPLTGTVYYNSYGTALALNFCCTDATPPALFGGATLAIKRGATSPVLIAGGSGGTLAAPAADSTKCRVCHSVAAGGATLITQHGDDYNASSAYALTAANAETPMTPDSLFVLPAISPDGTFLFSNVGPLPNTNPAPTSGLFSIPSGTPIASTGLPANFGAATPIFSPDGTHVAFNAYSTDQVSLGVLDFANNAFSNLATLHTPPSGTSDLFPAFLPTNDAVVFEHETMSDGEFGVTRSGTRGELWWVDLKTHTAAALANLNGVGYLPTGPNSHTTDETLDYEPTVNPVASGGYAWVVFTSRRLYGNVATQDPFLSDPRMYNPATSATTKKLWVAAIDLNAKPGTDPSHPAFYLPAQELLAGNSRGFWVVDPCEQNGASCVTGDQCCSGFCESGGADGGYVCGAPSAGCSALGNKCKTTSDCCGSSSGIDCIDGYCATPTPP